MTIEKQRQRESQNSLKNNNSQTYENLNQMLEELKKWNVSEEKMEHMVSYVIKLAWIEAKYLTQKEELKKEIRGFILSTFDWKLTKNLAKFDVQKFDFDSNSQIDEEEENEYGQTIGQAISQIITLSWVERFSRVYEESNSKSWIDTYLAWKLNFWNWKKQDKNYLESLMLKAWNTQLLKEMEEKRFDITSKESLWELTILLTKEIWNWVEDILRFILNIPAWIILIPRYTIYRTQTSKDNLDEKSRIENEIKLEELVRENPSLWLVELFWEKWIEMLKTLASMMQSGKQWDLAKFISSIWLSVIWLSIARSWVNFAREKAVKSAKRAWREARISWETTSRTTRNTLKKASNKIWKVSDVISKVDDAVFWAWIWYLTGQFWANAERLKEWQKLLKLEEKIISGMNDIELIKFLVESKVKQLDISDLSHDQKARINHVLTQNFPLVEVYRLVSGDSLHTINTAWTKQINEVAGQEFMDKLSDKFKEILRQNIQKNDDKTHQTRTVQDNYKVSAFVSKDKNFMQRLFTWENKDDIIEKVISSLEVEIIQNARKIIEKQIEEWKIHISINSSEFDKLVADKALETEQTIRKYFDFSYSVEVIPESSDPIARLDTMRKWEISSKPLERTVEIIQKTYDEVENMRNLRQVFELEAEIIEEFNWQQFHFRWNPYNIVFNNSWEYWISTELLKYVRKYPEEIEPWSLVSKIKQYFWLLNNSLDYISPIRWKIDAKSEEFVRAREINERFHNWVVDIKDLLETNKWWLTKQAFLETITWKKGHLFSIDIKDMWIENILDFRNLARKLIALEDEFNSWRITKEVCESRKALLYQEAWKAVTDKFIKFQEKIKKKYKEAVYRIGWDEIELFIPNWSETLSQITWNLSDMLESSNLKSRMVSYSFDWTTDVKTATSNLDKMTKVSKLLEEEIWWQLSRENRIWNVPNNTQVYVDGIWEMIMQEWFDFEGLFKQIKKVLSENDLKNISGEKVIEVWNQVKMKILKNNNGQLEIYLLKS